MVSSNSKKVSALDLATTTSAGDNLLIIKGMGVGEVPASSRIPIQNVFLNIPAQVVVGTEYNGEAVVFNASDQPTHNFQFDHTNGTVTVGGDLVVAGANTNILGDFSVSGNTVFTNSTFTNIIVEGVFTANSTSVMVDDVSMSGNLDITGDLLVNGMVAMLNSLTVTGGVTANTATFTTVTTDSLTVVNDITVANVHSDSIDTQDLVATGDIETENLIANGYITANGNIYANIGNFDGLSVVSNATFLANITANTVNTDSLTSANSTVTGTATIENLTSNVSTSNTHTTVDITATNATLDEITSINVVSNTVSTTDLTSININTNDVVSNTANVATLEVNTPIIPILGSLPPLNTSANGQIHCVETGGNYYIAIKTPAGWKAAMLSNI